MGWDQHENLPTQIRGQANDIDQPTAALIMDLKQRGLLEDTCSLGWRIWKNTYSQGSQAALKNNT